MRSSLRSTFVTCLILCPGGTSWAQGPASYQVTGVVRDFRTAHSDFDASGWNGHAAGNVERYLGADGRPVYSGLGSRVAAQWQDAAGRNIAPLWFNYYAPVGTCIGLPGLSANGFVSIKNQSVVDSYDSSAGPYGGANVGQSAVVSTNSTGPGQLAHQNSTDIWGDVFVGPGGDPATVYTTHPTCNLGGSLKALDAPIPMPVARVPDLGPSAGDLVYDAPGVISGDLHCDALEIDGAGSVTIDGDVRIVAEGEVTIDGGGLTVLAGSRLTIYCMKGLSISVPVNMPGGLSGDPDALHIFAVGPEPVAVKGNGAALAARIYAPQGVLEIETGAKVFGTYVGNLVDMDNKAEFHMDVSHGGQPTFAPDTAGAAGGAEGGSVTSAATFDGWFRDVLGVNLSSWHTITMVLGGDGVYEYTTGAFHPVDGRLLGNEGALHNRNFTFEIDAMFAYQACTGQMLEVRAGDDAWVFIDGELVIDLGGLGANTLQRFDVDRLGLEDGEAYRFQLFSAQRQDTSSDFSLRTNMVLTTSPNFDPPSISDVGD